LEREAVTGLRTEDANVGKSGEFYTFDEVLKRLAINESKLKRLVSEGEIRAFREGDQMKFRRSDVENLDVTGARSEEETGVIDLSKGKEESSETLTDDLIFDEGDDLDLTSAEAGMQTAEISSQDTFVDEGGVGMTTEPLPSDVGDSTEVVEEKTTTTRTTRAPARRAVAAAPEEPKDTAWAIVMTVTTVVLVLGLVVVMTIREMNLEHKPVPSPDSIGHKIATTFRTPAK
jgi:excisionase family DNA binding protein